MIKIVLISGLSVFNSLNFCLFKIVAKDSKVFRHGMGIPLLRCLIKVIIIG